MTYGLYLKGPHVLARTVMVIEPRTLCGICSHSRTDPAADLDEAFAVAKSLVTGS
jgi:hypothetical protein